ncbi:glycosyltransferase [Paenibacillus glycanilyticus]|uniref:glycosyltransferase n=1 Tax=Paenibacillus glycanilyticus TaxID=126569 RepID=UPI0019103ABD|nr:glycosyltransferase [Paenibacillus glycanilyticus]
MLTVIFFVALFLLLYPYVIYPLLLIGSTKAFPRTQQNQPTDTETYTVDILIPVYNEEKFISEKLRNLLTYECDWRQIQVLIGADGCKDKTCELIRAFQSEHPEIAVRLFDFETNRGKSTVLNELAERSRADILILTDASTMFAPQTVNELIKHYGDSSITGICGCKMISTDDYSDTGKNEGFYWKFEARLKELESQLYSVIGAEGPVFSIRREDYVPLHPSVLLDDFLVCMAAVTRTKRVVYERNAVGYEKSSESYSNEYIRRKRIAIGAYQFLKMMVINRYLLQWNLRTLFSLISHKIIRWTSPFYMILLYLSNLILLLQKGGNPFFFVAFVGQSLFYLLTILIHRNEYKAFGRKGELLNSVAYLVMSNLLQIQGVYKGLFKEQNGRWKTVNR